MTRRARLFLVFLFILTHAYVYRGASETEVTSGLPQELDDLYEIFNKEIRSGMAGNVYAGLGNQLQLDGKAYNYAMPALNAYDLLREAHTSSGPQGESFQNQLKKTRKAFTALLESINWPHYEIALEEKKMGFSGPERPEVCEKIKQPILLTFDNLSSDTQVLTLSSGELSFSSRQLKVASGSVRHLLATLEAKDAGNVTATIRIAGQEASLEADLEVEARRTGILEGVLVEKLGRDLPIARVRVTDSEGVYCPPETHRYGLILKMFGPEHGQTAQRWFYGEGEFRVRVPAGRVKVAIRRGLEYRSIDQEVEILPGQTVRKEFELRRWIDMEKRGWYSGDVHIHFLEPKSALFEMAAEDLHVAEVLVLKHYDSLSAREYFTGALDPVSNERHLVYYNEEFRNRRLGHVGLLKLKRLVEPVSTGAIGASRRQFYRNSYFSAPDQPPSRAGEASPDRLLLEAMRETHEQEGLVNWAHLRKELEFALDAALGELDAVDILANTRVREAQRSWYHLLNCGFRLPATAGTDRGGPARPVGHHRTYVRLEGPFTYENWIQGIKKGSTLVTNGPMVLLRVDGAPPGTELKFSHPGRVRVQAEVISQLPFQHLEIVVNGDVVRKVQSDGDGRNARIAFEQPVGESLWIAARCIGTKHPEIIYYPHPVFAHTSPVYVQYRDERIEKSESAGYLLEFMRRLESWAREEAYFGNEGKKEEALSTIRRGMDFYRRIAGQPGT